MLVVVGGAVVLINHQFSSSSNVEGQNVSWKPNRIQTSSPSAGNQHGLTDGVSIFNRVIAIPLVGGWGVGGVSACCHSSLEQRCVFHTSVSLPCRHVDNFTGASSGVIWGGGAALLPPDAGGSVSAAPKGSDCNLDQHILAPS